MKKVLIQLRSLYNAEIIIIFIIIMMMIMAMCLILNATMDEWLTIDHKM